MNILSRGARSPIGLLSKEGLWTFKENEWRDPIANELQSNFYPTSLLECVNDSDSENTSIPIYDISALCNKSANFMMAAVDGALSLIYPAACDYINYAYCGVQTSNDCSSNTLYISQSYFNQTDSLELAIDVRAVARIERLCSSHDDSGALLSNIGVVAASIGAGVLLGILIGCLGCRHEDHARHEPAAQLKELLGDSHTENNA